MTHLNNFTLVLHFFCSSKRDFKHLKGAFFSLPNKVDFCIPDLFHVVIFYHPVVNLLLSKMSVRFALGYAVASVNLCFCRQNLIFFFIYFPE